MRVIRDGWAHCMEVIGEEKRMNSRRWIPTNQTRKERRFLQKGIGVCSNVEAKQSKTKQNKKLALFDPVLSSKLSSALKFGQPSCRARLDRDFNRLYALTQKMDSDSRIPLHLRALLLRRQKARLGIEPRSSSYNWRSTIHCRKGERQYSASFATR